jgi:hypothetical protein
MLTKSNDHNPNYLAKVVSLKGLKKHSNADRLQVVDIDFQTVITGMDAEDGDICVFFPLESKISQDFLSATNSFRDKKSNADDTKQGFFDDNCRVRAMKLRGEKSMGYLVPVDQVILWSGYDDAGGTIGQEFDTVNGKLIVEKYQIKRKVEPQARQGKKPKVSRLVDGQIHLHADTENLRRNVHKINPEDTISITYKTHGTSWWVSNVLVKRELSNVEKVIKWLGLPVQELEYDLVYGSRKVVKNSSMNDPKQKDHFFGYDLWEKIKDEVGDKIPKGYTLYGEMLGYDHNGGYIQKGYDYGCKPVSASEMTPSQYRKAWKDLYSDQDREDILRYKFNSFHDRVIKKLDYLKGVCSDLGIREEMIYPFITRRDERPQHKLEVYRITQTTPDGLVTELSYPQIADFCRRNDLTPPHLFYHGRSVDWLMENIDTLRIPEISEENWGENLIKNLEQEYNEKDCFMCNNKVPEEGIVVRKESLFNFEAYKLKSFNFLEQETKELDSGESDIESDN